MATTEELAKRWAQLAARRKKLQEEIEAVERELMPHMKPGDEIVIGTKKVRMRDRRQLNDMALEERVSSETWEAITVRKSDALLLKLALRNGRISEHDIDACSGRTRPWLEVK
jgi:hypothetical protein